MYVDAGGGGLNACERERMWWNRSRGDMGWFYVGDGAG